MIIQQTYYEHAFEYSVAASFSNYAAVRSNHNARNYNGYDGHDEGMHENL